MKRIFADTIVRYSRGQATRDEVGQALDGLAKNTVRTLTGRDPVGAKQAELSASDKVYDLARRRR